MTTRPVRPSTPSRTPGPPEHHGPDILCDGLVRIFSAEGVEVVALQGLDLEVGRGELVAVVGASGSGKSTLLRILSGLDLPSAGVARVAGRDLLTMSTKDRLHYRRHTVGFLFQQAAANLVPYLSAVENVELPMVFASLSPAERAVRAAETLEVLGVADCADRRLDELSGGQQQRVALGVALANRPRVLLADEPTGELDSRSSDEVFGAIREANESFGTTVVVVTHDAHVSEQVTRTVGIRDGRTSSEVRRRTSVDEYGVEGVVAEEFAVLDRAGRLQLPRGFTDALGMRDRVRLDLEADHIGVWPTARPDAAVPRADPDVGGDVDEQGEGRA
ncbi:MAG TPA: ABC transporter ATP-binding protein [Ornithinibacter sp.]|nr:ABC transporter ATP-binding protein [Ornithinibacter sp.]